MERRLRSSSEGAGGPRIHGNHRDAVGMEGCGLLKHRNNSSSSKLGSLVGVELCVCVCFNYLAFAFELYHITVVYFNQFNKMYILIGRARQEIVLYIMQINVLEQHLKT